MNCPRVASLVLCNTFTDTTVFEYKDSAALFWLLPSLVLKRMLMGNFTTDKVDKRMAESIDFMVERVSMTNRLRSTTHYNSIYYLIHIRIRIWCLINFISKTDSTYSFGVIVTV